MMLFTNDKCQSAFILCLLPRRHFLAGSYPLATMLGRQELIARPTSQPADSLVLQPIIATIVRFFPFPLAM